jgi:hypothetical protein
MKSLWFVVPAYARFDLTRICLRQLRRTCDALELDGVRASAVVVADDDNLTTATDLGFATVRRDNRYLSRKFNDGIQLALDPRHNAHPADYVVPCGSDDWIDHRALLDLPDDRTMVGFQRISVVREDGCELTTRFLNYSGGSGIRIYPAALMRPLGYRPADPDRQRACDTSILTNLAHYWTGRMRIMHHHLHDYQVVDWKSPVEQLNTYEQLATVHRGSEAQDPFVVLAGVYPDESLMDMQQHYASRRQAAA